MSPKSETSATPSSSKDDENSPKKMANKKDEPNPDDDLSEEDKQLKEDLELSVSRLSEAQSDLYPAALENLRRLIRASTTSMTSVPKPLKFLMPHYNTMKVVFEKLPPGQNRRECADIISVLAMTAVGIEKAKEEAAAAALLKAEEEAKEEAKAGPEEKAKAAKKKAAEKPKKVAPAETMEVDTTPKLPIVPNECLKFKLQGHTDGPNLDAWGHEFIRHLSGEIVSEWAELDEEEQPELKKQIEDLVREIIPLQMKHHAEAEACDLLMEVELLDLILQYVDKSAFQRVCLYLTSCVPYVPDPENTNLLKTTYKIFRKFDQYPQAMRVAMQINDPELIKAVFMECPDPLLQKQLAYMMGRQQHYMELDENDFDEVVEIMSNIHLNHHFLNLARELDILEPKTPDDVYKTHLDNVRPFGGGAMDSAKHNLASSFVNGFVNAGFGKDKLLMEDGNKWLYKHKEAGMMSATASIGLVLLWDVDGGLTQIDKYLYSPEDHIKSGALLACGIVNTGVRNDCDPALALLSDYITHDSMIMRAGATLGLGLAYSGSNREEVIGHLLPVFADPKASMENISITALALGLIGVGSCNNEITTVLLQTLMEKSESDLKDPFAKFLPLGIGLCYLGKQEAAEATIATLEVLSDPFKSMAMTLVDVCAYAGTGNVLKIQNLLHICSEHYEPSNGDDDKKDKKKDKKDDKKTTTDEVDLSMQQSVAVIGLALIAMGEDIGSEMLFRTFGHLLRYCEPVIRRAVPLALGLISVSNPQLPILDTLSKFSHDADPEVAHNSIFALGLIGAGTNNARLAAMLRQLAQYHSKDPNNLFMTRVAQGLVHMGKGTLTLNPYHSDSQLMSPVAVAGLMGCIISFLDVKSTILGKSHYLLYTLATALQPRMLVTFDEELRPLSVSVRVGQAVDVVGQAGKPKTITGFQTHTTPVLLASGERAELATEEYIPVTPIMEGFVILKKNPDY